jgi:hypothetical protein
MIYIEKVTSVWTGLLFLALTLLFALLMLWRISARGWDGFAIVGLILAFLFLFYTFNYRVLMIRISTTAIRLDFGIFHWTTPLAEIHRCRLDDNIPALNKYGGAGIHFMTVHRRYRASFNFLEHPRIVLELKQRRGLVRDVSFSTRWPEKILALVQPLLQT